MYKVFHIHLWSYQLCSNSHYCTILAIQLLPHIKLYSAQYFSVPVDYICVLSCAVQCTFTHLHICVLKDTSVLCSVHLHICTLVCSWDTVVQRTFAHLCAQETLLCTAHLHTCVLKGRVVQCSALRHFPFSPLLLNQPTNIHTLFAAALRKGFRQILNKKKLSKLHKTII